MVGCFTGRGIMVGCFTGRGITRRHAIGCPPRRKRKGGYHNECDTAADDSQWYRAQFAAAAIR